MSLASLEQFILLPRQLRLPVFLFILHLIETVCTHSYNVTHSLLVNCLKLLDNVRAIVYVSGFSYPPSVIDWTIWEPAGPTDSRSPCPMINALCNHHILPHDGRNITKVMAVQALHRALNLDPMTGVAFTSQACALNPEKSADWFDMHHLNRHGPIEHDVSLSRGDVSFGDNHTFNHDIWANTITTYGTDHETCFESVSKARFGRVKASKKAHDEAGLHFQYGIKELILSYGESALLLSLLGDPVNGKIPLQYIRILIEQARVPYIEGWRKSSRLITQFDMLHLILSLIHANKEKESETEIVEMNNVHEIAAAVEKMVPDLCRMM